ncbi:hypothetical protein BWQ96_09085 [Gracilariopsis chorda]|uniref:Chromo domain-containing protein n=1 Tax=Gracilariopsis chorda TaxID=448386 RepID=A0A2V3IGI6_9FLOR|nr:hypothetical protein BWQ96_09085 [Gracilariopsis chorda]|eukprot:PXF41191.1 hypothetical protein BWQ96_09085 [Gracilariopsis chorda]
MVDLQDKGIFQDVNGEMKPAQAKSYSRKRIDSILKAAQTHFDKPQKPYKADFDKAIWFVPQFSPGDYVHLDRPPKEKQETEDTASKLVPRSTGPYGVINSTGHTVTIDRDGLQDMVSTDHVSMAPRPLVGRMRHPTRSASVPQAVARTSPRVLTPPPPALRSSSTPVVDASPSGLPLPFRPVTSAAPSGTRAVTNDPLRPQVNKAGLQGAVADDLGGHKNVSSDDGYVDFEDMYLPEKNRREYVIDCIVSTGVDEKVEVLYKVRWYGYGPEDGRWIPPESIPANFINRYWTKMGYKQRDLRKGRITDHRFTAKTPRNAAGQ